MVIDTIERSFSYSFPINLLHWLIAVSAYDYRSANRVPQRSFRARKHGSPLCPNFTARLPEQSLAPYLLQLRTCITPLRYALALRA